MKDYELVLANINACFFMFIVSKARSIADSASVCLTIMRCKRSAFIRLMRRCPMKMVGPPRFELGTTRLSVGHSTRLSHGPKKAPRARIELATFRLTAERSTAKLPGHQRERTNIVFKKVMVL